MRFYRKRQFLVIMALIVAIISLGIGFAAFATTLNIASSATVSPSSDSFSIGFYASKSQETGEDAVSYPDMGSGATGTFIDIVGGTKALTGLGASFSKPGSVVVYNLFIKNDGEYDAYLNKVNINQNATCDAGTVATDSLVQSACEGIRIAFMVDGYDESLSGDVNIPIAVGEYLSVKVIMRYREGSAYADGPFNAYFDPISIEFNTIGDETNIDGGVIVPDEDDVVIDPFANARTITFEFYGDTYSAKEGMTWADYVNSEYNSSFFISGSYVKYMITGFESVYVYDSIIPVMDTDIIMDAYSYDWNFQ